MDNSLKTQFRSESWFTSIKESVIGLLGSDIIIGNNSKTWFFLDKYPR